MDHNRFPPLIKAVEAFSFRGQKTTGSYVIEVTEFIFEVSIDLRGPLEAQNVQKLNRRILAQI